MSALRLRNTVGQYSVLLRNGGGAGRAPSLPQWGFLGWTKQGRTPKHQVCLLRNRSQFPAKASTAPISWNGAWWR